MILWRLSTPLAVSKNAYERSTHNFKEIVKLIFKDAFMTESVEFFLRHICVKQRGRCTKSQPNVFYTHRSTLDFGNALMKDISHRIFKLYILYIT
jgi:hypothetical protein